MKKTKNNKVSKESKGQETKTTKMVKETKGHAEQEAIKTLMDETMKKLADLAPYIETIPRARYTGYKFNGRLLSSIMGKRLSFDMSIHEYSEKGTHTSTEHFEIKSTSKDVAVVINGLLEQVRKNYDILTEAAKPKKIKKVEAKKETFKEVKIVEEIPIKTKKEVKKEEKKDEKNSN